VLNLRLDAEKYGERGGITGKGASRVLSGTQLNPLEVVVREAIQNSWDARIAEKIVFGLKAYRFTPSQRIAALAALRDGFVSKDPVLGKEPHQLEGLVLYDRGTSGLDGPTTAGGIEEGNFERFFFGFGETKPQPGRVAAGGTYGFGRSSFLRCSVFNTILVHTRCRVGKNQSKLESRLIGMTFRDGYKRKEHRYTGRHWWVKPGAEFGPLTGPPADTLASSFGMPIPSIQDSGTTILIVQPMWSLASADNADTDEDDLAAARERILEALQWNSWPHLADQSMGIRVDWFGDSVPVADPRTHPRLAMFVRALEVAKKQKATRMADKHVAIACQRPIQRLGSLGLSRAPHVPSPASTALSYLPADGPLHHVALMRGAQLIVKYLECAAPREAEQYAGVFLVDEEVDSVFARSEPAAHDEWDRQQLEERRERTFVHVAIKRVQEEVRELLSSEGEAAGGDASNLAGIAEELGGLLPASDGDGAGGWRPGGSRPKGGGKGRKSPGSITLQAPSRSAEGEDVILSVPFDLEGLSRSTTLVASVAVHVEGGSEEAPPEGASRPEVLGWKLGSDSRMVKGPKVDVSKDTSSGTLLVRQPKDCTVSLSIDVLG
jgi:hypothetical protein